MTSYTARLLTASATTGWDDWIHGELWLFPRGVLRIPLGFWKTLAHVWRTVDPHSLKERSFEQEQFRRLITTQENLWIPCEQIEQAYLRHSFGTDQLQLELVEGNTVLLLWRSIDRAFHPLETSLRDWLGDGLIVG